ncbi:MAG: diguanylate cyclase [Desulfovibrio sp.]|nr:MAG: diguanylate cyclase [Desulfovibrio sp.]
MANILIVEDSRTFALLLSRALTSRLGLESTWVKTYDEAQEKLQHDSDAFSMALLDINLPDAPNGEVVDLVLGYEIPSLVFSSEISDDLRDSIWSKGIVDYVYKEGAENVDYIVATINNILTNQEIGVLVVDDSTTSRNHITKLLRIHQYDVIATDNGQDALALLEANDHIRLVLTAYVMPDMNGYELTKAIRKQYRRDDLALIGVSGDDETATSAKFIKAGANDYITKPFLFEEFYCRITQNIEIIEYIKRIRELSEKDFLTKLYNRKYLFDAGGLLYANQQRTNNEIAVALLDLDNFKAINDTYGHAAGDEVLITVAKLLQDRFRKSDIVCRYGGEEFCILATNMARDQARTVFEDLRQAVADISLYLDGETIEFTTSIGLCLNPMDSLEQMISKADAKLYQAKNSGKNQVRVFPEAE